jgi:acetate kinase
MKTILVLNCGSSSVKYALFHNKSEVVRGIIELKRKTHKKAIQTILHLLVRKGYVVSLGTINAVGHRVVHGGEITKSVRITKTIIKKIKETAKLAPLHNPHNLEGISAIQKILGQIPQIAVFDTTFHHNIPSKTEYALPPEYSKKYKRYGFHGISYQYICSELKRTLKKLPKRLIICHLGNGSSIAAVKSGRCIDTSMGYTPAEGLAMGTRTGDIDAGVVLDLCRKKSVGAVDFLLNKKSGLHGICGSNDMRVIWKRVQQRNKKAQDALTLYCYRIQKYIGAYAAALGGLDCLVFTAGIGENAWWVRKQVCDNLGFLGVSLDTRKNKKNVVKVNKGNVSVYVLKTNEEKMIFEEVNRLS